MNLFKAEAVKAPFSRPLHAARGRRQAAGHGPSELDFPPLVNRKL